MEGISWALCSMVALTREETCIYEGKDIPSSTTSPRRLDRPDREAMQRPHSTGQVGAPSPPRCPSVPLCLGGVLVPWVPSANSTRGVV